MHSRIHVTFVLIRVRTAIEKGAEKRFGHMSEDLVTVCMCNEGVDFVLVNIIKTVIQTKKTHGLT